VPKHGATGLKRGATVPANVSMILSPNPLAKAYGVMDLLLQGGIPQI
jgi:hypothetical protein